MAAVVTPGQVSHLRPVPDLVEGPAAGQRPDLRLVPNLPARPSTARFMVRRTVAAVVLIALLIGSWAAVSAMASVALPADAALGGVPAPQIADSDQVYVVAPGDTLWSIARALQPTGDVRPLVHQLSELNGGADLDVGQPVRLP